MVWSVVLMFFIRGSVCWHYQLWQVQPPWVLSPPHPSGFTQICFFQQFKTFSKDGISLTQLLQAATTFLKKREGKKKICAGVFTRFPKLGAATPKSSSECYRLFPHLTTANMQIHLSSLHSSPKVILQTGVGRRKRSGAKEPGARCRILCLSVPGSKTDP